ncbi:MAG: type II secretion system F family protein [Patescibacteria group bacterium]|nr:type II secretion system F family protein [Patescibacteria group bacterium]
MLATDASRELAIYIAAGLIALGATAWIALGAISRLVAPRYRGLIPWARLALGIAILASVVVPLAALFLLSIPLSFIVCFIISPMAILEYERWRREAVFGLILTSFRRGIPLEAAFSTFAGRLGPAFRKRATRFIDRLQRGEPMADALCATPGLVPRECVPLLVMSIESGAVAGGKPAALAAAQSMVNTRRELDAVRQAIAGKVFYLLGVMTFMLLMAVFLSWRIIPTFEKIHDDFGATMPRMSQLVVNLSHQGGWLALAAFLALLGLFIFAILRLAYGIPIDPPGVGRMLRPLDRAAVLEAMSIGVDCRRPLPDTLAIVARTFPKKSLRRPLWRVHDAVARGADWIDSMVEARILRPTDAALLRSAAAAGNLPWAMRALADSSRRLFIYRTNVLLQIAFPIAIFALACVVGFVVIGLFMPLIRLVVALT